MPKVKLTSKNTSLTIGGVRLTQKEPIADVTSELARLFCDSGKAEVICQADTNGKAIDPPYAAEECAEINIEDLDEDFANELKLDAAECAAAFVESNDDGSDVVVADITPLTADMIKAATTKSALVALADEYGIDLSGCTNNDERRAVLTSALEQ